MNELRKCFPDGGPCTVEQYFRMLYEKPHSPSWALLPADYRESEMVSVSRQPLVSNKLERWPGSEEMYSRKLLAGPERQKTVSAGNKQDLKSLFDAVELSWYSKVCSLVTSPGLQINGLNEDGMTPLDVALLLGDTPVARVLQHHGAVESARYRDEAGLRYQHVLALLQETEISRTSVLTNPCNLTLDVDNSDIKHNEIDRKLWKYHSMLSTLKNTGLPKAPQQLSLSVQTSSSIKLQCYEPPDTKSSLVTQYKIQWSGCPNLKSDVRTEIVSAGHCLTYLISGLNKGTCYYFSVQAGNIKGYGAPTHIQKCTPSHWSDSSPQPDPLEHKSTCSTVLSDLRSQFHSLFPALLSQTPSKYKTRNKSLSRIFTTPKFVKTLNRSLYLAVMQCTESGKVLLSDADKLPTVEVEDLVTAPSADTELLWLFKHAVAGWPATRDLKDELAPYQDVGGVGLRYKILSAVLYLQECLSCNDLGIPYYRLVKKNGQLIILLIKTIESTTSPFGNVHLRPLSTLTTGLVQPRDAFDLAHLNAGELQTLYSRYDQPPTRGLFVGLLLFKMKGEDLELVVDKASPLLPPLEYVREVAHVTQEEWASLRGLQTANNSVRGSQTANNSVLCKQVSAAACTLLSRIQDTVSDIDSYAIYTRTIVELGGAAVILVIPPQIVAPLGYDNDIEGTISVPLQNFEILFNRLNDSELTRSILHTNTHINTCHHVLSQMVRQALSSEQIGQLRTSQEKMKGLFDQISGIWGQYCTFSMVLSDCMKEGYDCLRSISDLLRQTPNSPATSITDTFSSSEQSPKSGVVRIYSSEHVTILPPCIKLHITHTTSSRDVINSVVRKLRRQGGTSPPEEDQLEELCLVACVSNITHQIPDTVQILQLGQPWVNAKFYIRFGDWANS